MSGFHVIILYQNQRYDIERWLIRQRFCNVAFSISLDDIPPVVNNCTQEVTLEAMKGEDFVRVTWTEPTSVDSLEGGSLVNRTHAPLDPFPVDETTVVWYIFEDEAGFQTFCSINITIEKGIVF